MIERATKRVQEGWVVGYGDEVWWSRLAQPRMHAWCEQGQPLRLQEFGVDKEDADPKALCCYGLLRADTSRVWLRFVDGRPVSHVTTAYLQWVCERLDAENKRVLVLIWDNATWHRSREVMSWIRQHNHLVLAGWREDAEGGEGKSGVQIIPCFLPIKSPWLNPIEPRWVHSKRAVVEPASKLTAQQLTDRVCDYFGSVHHDHLKQYLS